jgi:hypothetical protein
MVAQGILRSVYVTRRAIGPSTPLTALFVQNGSVQLREPGPGVMSSMRDATGRLRGNEVFSHVAGTKVLLVCEGCQCSPLHSADTVEVLAVRSTILTAQFDYVAYDP